MKLPAVLRSLGVAATVLALVALEVPAYAAPATDFEMPFPCGQSWTGTTRSYHTPSPYAVDWNRLNDLVSPVVASAPGVVTTAYATPTGGYGRWVVIDHGNGETSLYAHMLAVNVKVGQYVDQGALIGKLGSSGNSTGPHLHFEERLNGKDFSPWFHQAAYVFGTTQASRNCVDVPLAGNFVGTKAAELAVYRRAATSKFLIQSPTGKVLRRRWGLPTDEPIIGDWDGDGHDNIGVYTPSTSTFSLVVARHATTITFGVPGDRPITGDWNGDGTTDVGVWRPSDNTFYERFPDGTTQAISLGTASSLPVTGDWNGDGITDVGVYDYSSATFTLRLSDDNGLVWLAQVQYGAVGDLPVTGDWDGNGKTDIGTWDPATAIYSERMAPSATSARTAIRNLRWGRPR